MLSLSLRRTGGALCLSAFFAVSNVDAQVCTDVQGTRACLDEVEENGRIQPLGQRLPLILVHGWNRNGIAAPPDEDSLNKFLNFVIDDSSLRTRFKVYMFRYFSNVATVPEIGRALRYVIDERNRIDSTGFGSRQISIVAHSMGGLIARYTLGLPQSAGSFAGRETGERVSVLITLGTPHHGTMASNGPAIFSKAGPAWTWLLETLFTLLYPHMNPNWFEVNRTDLLWDNYDKALDYESFPSEQNILLNNLNSRTTYDDKLIAYGGVFSPCPDLTNKYCVGSTGISALFDVDSDGIVPINSALFYQASSDEPRIRTRRFRQYDHTEIASGKGDGELFGALKFDLLGAVGNAPSPSPSTCRIGQLDLVLNITFVGELTDGDCLAPHRSESRADVYSLQASVGQRIRITMDAYSSPNPLPDPYLIFVDPSGTVVAENDDSGNGLNASIDYVARVAGRYSIEATAYGASDRGEYLLSVLVENVSNRPGSPVDLTASVQGSSVTLSWGAPRSGGQPTAYLIEAGSAPGASDFTITIDTGQTVTAFVMNDLPSGTYYFRVKARNSAGLSGASNEVVVRVGTDTNVTGTWSLTAAPGPYRPYSSFIVTLVQNGATLTGSILPVGTSRPTPLNGYVLARQLRFGSEHAWWNDVINGRPDIGDDIYFDLTIDSTNNRMTGSCGSDNCGLVTAVRLP